jgi:hypothetical protein
MEEWRYSSREPQEKKTLDFGAQNGLEIRGEECCGKPNYRR